MKDLKRGLMVLTILIFILLFLTNTKLEKFTGNVVFSGDTSSNLATPLSGWEPLGSYPEKTFTNTYGSDLQNNRYFFTYQDDNLRITYFIYINESGIFKAVKANVSINNNNIEFNPSTGGIEAELNGSKYNSWDFDSINRTIISYNLNNQKLFMLINFSKDKDYLILNLSYWIEGKTLKIKATSKSGKISSFQLGKTGGQPPKEYIPPVIPHTSSYINSIIRKGEVFFTIYNNWDISKSSSLSYYYPFKESEYVTNLNSYIYYKKNTEDSYKNVDEIFYIIISDDISDLFPNNPNTVSIYKNYLANITILDFWGTNNTNSLAYIQKLNNYKIENVTVNFLSRKWPYNDLINNIKPLGYEVISYSIYIDCYTDDTNCYKNSYLQQLANGSIFPTYFSSTRGQAYALRYDKHKYIAQILEPTIKNQGQKGIFLDTVAANLPWKYVDLNGTILNGSNSSYLFNVANQIDTLNYLHSLYNGPILTEGVNPLFWIGNVDSIEGSTSFTNSENSNLIVDLDLLIFHPKTVMYSGYYRRFFNGAGNDATWTGINSNSYDKYTATHIAFGHAAFIDSTAPWLHNVSDQLVVRYYYLTKALQKEYYLYNATEIKYYSSNQWKSLSDAIRDNYDFVNAQVKVVYNNGLNVYVNRHSSSNLIVNYNEKDYTIPPSGWLAYNDNDGFFEFSGLQNGHRIDIVESMDYTYLDSRDAVEVINVKPRQYKVSKFNFTSGSLRVYSNQTSFSAAQLNQPLRLDALGSYSGTSTLVMDHGTTSNPSSTSSSGGGSAGGGSGGGGDSGLNPINALADTANNAADSIKNKNLNAELSKITNVSNLTSNSFAERREAYTAEVQKFVALNFVPMSILFLVIILFVSARSYFVMKKRGENPPIT